jgi:hypothetical protein
LEQDYKEEENVTKVWVEYQKGVMFNRSHNLYTDTDKNYNFYHGNQWEGAKLGDIQPVVFNIIKPIVKYKLGVITQNRYEIVFHPNIYNTVEEGQTLEQLCKVLNSHIAKVWELQKADQKVREASKDACINAEGIVHTYFDDEVIAEVIDKNNICYGNENSSDIQSQPYIIIAYRQPVSQVKEKARELGIEESQIKLILPDSDVQEQAGYTGITDEVNPMCLVLLKYYKKNGKVYYTKGTKHVELEKEKATDMNLYPIAHCIWEEKKGSSRGIGAVSCIIPNQIEINKIDARRALAVKIGAFQKLVYNQELVANAKELSKVGGAIAIKGGATVDDVRKAIGYIYPSSMSSDAGNLSAEMKSNTRELEGAGDTATGNVDPTQASGKAILAVQQASQQPLGEQVENYKEFVEDLARIWFDMWKAYEVNGMNIMYEQKDSEGNIIQEPGIISYEALQKLEPHIKVDITPRGSYDRYAQEMSLENLFMNDKITFDEYVESLPADAVMPKATLEKIVNRRKENAQRLTEMQMEANQLESAMNQVMELQGGGMNEMSTMQTSGNGSPGGQEQPSEVAM